MTENEADAYLTVVEGWLRNNRGIVFTEGAVDDLCDRVASVLADNARLRRDLAIWERNGGDILQRAEIERLKAENKWLYDQIAAQKRTAGAAAVAALEPKP